MSLPADAIFAGLGAAPQTAYRDSSLSGLHGTLVGSPPWVTVSGHGSRQWLDCSSGKYAVVGAVTAGTTWTLGAWVRPDTNPGNIAYAVGTGAARGLFWGLASGAGGSPDREWGFNGSAVLGADEVLTLGTAHYLSVEQVGTSYKLRRNGVGVKSGTTTATTISDLNVGRRSDGSWPADGAIADVCVWDRALSDAEHAWLADPANRLDAASNNAAAAAHHLAMMMGA